MANPPPPGTKPSQSYKDPYGGPINYDPPPAPGAPTTGAPNVLTLDVPAENTKIQLGASSGGPGGTGSNPGIRMYTDNHIHLTAGTAPPTTISLGAAGGDVRDAGTTGLSIYTGGAEKIHVVGKKDEKIDDAVTETYGNTKTENVTLKVTENYNNIKEENIKGPLSVRVENPVTNTFEATLTESVKGDWKVDPVVGNILFHPTGDYTVHAGGHVHVTGDQDCSWLQKGDAKHLWMGCWKKVTIGMDSSVNVGNKNSVSVGVLTDTKVAATLDHRLSASIENKAGVLCENGTLDKKNTAFNNVATNISIVKAATAMRDAAVAIFKHSLLVIKSGD
jgi:hypothetical protein